MTSLYLKPIDVGMIKFDSEFAISYIGSKPLSIFRDDIWDFSQHVDNLNCKKSDMQINFRIMLPNNTMLTDDTNHQLLTSCKGFLYANLTIYNPKSGKIIKPRSLVSIWYRLKPFMDWMIKNYINYFIDLEREHINQYLLHVTNLGLSAKTVGPKLSVLELMFYYSEHYPNSLAIHPWPNQSSYILSGQKRNMIESQAKQTLVIPSDIFNRIGSIALDYIENQSENIIHAHKECCAILDSYRPKALERIKSGAHKSHLIKREFQIQNCSTRAMKRTLVKIVTNHQFDNYSSLNKLVKNLHISAYIVCAMFSGIRDSELASLQINSFKSETRLGDETYHWIYGKTYKLEDQPKDVRWLVPECVKKAVTVLENISEYNRRNMHHQIEHLKLHNKDGQHQKNIQDLERNSKCLFLTKGVTEYSYRSMSNETANRRLKEFVIQHDIRCSKGTLWPIATHQFRRTFAVFVAKNLMGDLRYLRHHFKHWSIDMTLHYARLGNSDETLITEVMNERDQLTQLIVADWLSDETQLSGGRGKAIMNFKARNNVKTADSLSRASENLADGLFIRSTGHSWCLTNTESCGGQGLYDSLHCVSCKHAVIDPGLLPAWRGIRDHEAEILKMEDVGDPVKHHARNKIEAANLIIKELSGGE